MGGRVSAFKVEADVTRAWRLYPFLILADLRINLYALQIADRILRIPS